MELVVESAVLSAEHVENVLARLNACPVPATVETSLQLKDAPFPTLAATTACAPPAAIWCRSIMRDISAELKELRLHGMVSAWDELREQDESAVAASKWLIERLLQAKHTDGAMRSVIHLMFAAKFPLHRELASFDFASSKVDQPLVRQLATLTFTDTAQNVVLFGGPGTDKTHLATATKGKRVRFYSTVDLVNVLEREMRDGKAGRLAL